MDREELLVLASRAMAEQWQESARLHAHLGEICDALGVRRYDEILPALAALLPKSRVDRTL